MENLNRKYGLLYGAYNISSAAIVGYGSVYLAGIGHDSDGIGWIIAIGSIMGAYLQNLVSTKSKKSSKWTLYEYNLALVIPAIIILVAICFNMLPVLVLTVCFIIAQAVTNSLIPFINAISMQFINAGHRINFGAGRACGSIGYAITSILMGSLIKNFSYQVVPYVAIVGYLIYVYALRKLPIREVSKVPDKIDNGDPEKSIGFKAFIERYPHFIYLLIGSALLIGLHAAINVYMYKIVEDLSGNESQLGIAVAIAAFSEVLVMVNHRKLAQKFTNHKLAIAACWGFVLKMILTLFAKNIYHLYIAQACQMIAFGMYTVSSVSLANELVDDADTVEAQAILSVAQTIGSTLMILLAGYIVELFSVQYLIIFAMFGSAIGAILHQLAMKE